MHRAITIATFLPLVASTAVAQPPDADHAKHLTKMRKAKVEAARQMLDIVMKNYKDGNLPVVEMPYRWSTRLVEGSASSIHRRQTASPSCKPTWTGCATWNAWPAIASHSHHQRGRGDGGRVLSHRGGNLAGRGARVEVPHGALSLKADRQDRLRWTDWR
jgi:hypothetical protein